MTIGSTRGPSHALATAARTARSERVRHPLRGLRRLRGADRLSALDTMFLLLEDANEPLHIGSTMIFEGAPLRGPDGRIDRTGIIANLDAAVAALPRLRQRVRPGGILGRPSWIDDPTFEISRHIDFVSLEWPCTEHALRQRVSAFQSQRLDRDRPLWAMQVIDGLEQDRVAILLKIHHAIVDGVAGVGTLVTVLQPDRIRRRSRRPESGRRTFSRSIQKARSLAHPGRGFAGLRRTLRNAAVGLLHAARIVARPSPRTMINPKRTGLRRVFDWTSLDIESLRLIGHAVGGTLNDAVLAVTAGALRMFLLGRGERPRQLAMRVLVPVSTHQDQGSTSGNAVSILLAPIPADESDARRRLERVVAATRREKASHQSEGITWGEHLADWTTPHLLSVFVRTVMRLRPYNLIVTNVPGPDGPLEMLGARLLAAYPLVPLYGNQALGIALMSYAGRLYWGLNADADRIRDLAPFVDAIRESFVQLRAAVLIAQ